MGKKNKGLWICNELMEDKELTLQEKAFMAKMKCLDNNDGCYASNSYFAKYFNLSRQQCSVIIKQLEKKHRISIEYITEGKQIKKRVSRILDRGYQEDMTGGVMKTRGGCHENTKDRIYNNNIINKESTPIADTKKKRTKKPSPPKLRRSPSPFVPPTKEQVKEYVKAENLNIDPDKFWEFYDKNNWHDTNQKQVKVWKLKAVSWHQHADKFNNPANPQPKPIPKRKAGEGCE